MRMLTFNSCCRNSCKSGASIDRNNDKIEANLTNEFCEENRKYEHHVNTSKIYQTLNLPERFEHSYVFKGYGYQRKDTHPVFRTSNSEYGWYPPNPHTVPQKYFPKSNEFSSNLARCELNENVRTDCCNKKLSVFLVENIWGIWYSSGDARFIPKDLVQTSNVLADGQLEPNEAWNVANKLLKTIGIALA